MYTSTILPILALASSSMATVMPIWTPCEGSDIYTNTNQALAPGPPVTGNFSVAAGQVYMQSDYSVDVTVEVGLDLGLDFEDIGSAGISASVSYGTTNGVSQGGQVTCPQGAWECALIITPQVLRVQGTVAKWTEQGCSHGAPQPYTVDFPTTSNGLPTGAAVDICSCKNFVGWADPGAPSIVCPQPCVL